MRHVWFLVGLLGCIEPDLVPCPGTDLSCPAGTTCDALHGTCVSDEQRQLCVGLVDDSSCAITASGTAGYCRDEICLPIVCGNGIVDHSEACDDGNDASADGCNSTCSSNERCGNGRIDAIGNEQCDDGNLIDADGCDSRCLGEEQGWSMTGVSLHGEGAGTMVYDEARHEMVYFSLGSLWRYDGDRWDLLALEGPIMDGKILYDPDRARVVLLGEGSPGVLDAHWEWDGAAWSQRTIASPPAASYKWQFTYDRARGNVLLVTVTSAGVEASTFDGATATWTPIAKPTNATNTGAFSIAFDAVRGVAVFVEGDNTYEWNGSAWTAQVAPPPVPITGSVTFDAGEGAVVAMNGTSVMKWNGTTWDTLTAQALPSSRLDMAIAWDSDRQRRVAFGGTQQAYTTPLADLFEWDGATWHHITRPDPPFLGNVFNPAYGLTYGPAQRQLIQIGGSTEASMVAAWGLDETGEWHPLPESPIPYNLNDWYNSRAIAYDPIRKGIVVNTVDAGTYVLADDNTWDVLEPIGTSQVAGLMTVAFDPTRRALVGIDMNNTWLLPSDATSWTLLGPGPAPGSNRNAVAFDARANRMVAHSNFLVHELVGSDWVPSLSPGTGYQVVACPPRGSVLMMALGYRAQLWERLDGGLVERPRPPLTTPFFVANVYGTPDGTLRVLITVGLNARVVLEYRSTGTGSRDTCQGADEDGDEMVDCADTDCWSTCTPTCPPYASCAP